MCFFRHIRSVETTAKRMGWSVAVGFLALSSNAVAGEWTITPFGEIEQSVTDNARAVNEGREADLITTATAGVAVNGRGRRAQLNLDYTLSRDSYWDNSELSGLRHDLLGQGRVEAVEDLFFIDTRAAIRQLNLQRGGTITATDRTISSGDQSTVVNYTVTPSLPYRYGNWAESDLRYSFNETRFLDPDVGAADSQPDTVQNHTVSALVRNGSRFTRLNWQLSGTKTFTDNNSDREITELSGEYAWTRQVALLGRVGLEKFENSGLNSDDSREPFGLGGVRLTPGPRTELRVEAGYRFGGLSFSGDALYRLGSATVFRAFYEEDILTDRQAFAANLNNLIVGPEGNLINPDTGLPPSPNDSELDFLDRTTRQQNFGVSLNGTRGRNTFTLFGRGIIRTQEPEEIEDTVVVFGARIDRRIRPNLDGGIGADMSVVTESADGVKDYTLRSNAFLTYRLQESLSGSLRYDFLRRDSDLDTEDVQENIISVSLRKSF